MRPVHKADNLTTYLPLSWNLGTLTSWNPLGHSRPVTGLIYLYLNQSVGRFLLLNCVKLWELSLCLSSHNMKACWATRSDRFNYAQKSHCFIWKRGLNRSGHDGKQTGPAVEYWSFTTLGGVSTDWVWVLSSATFGSTGIDVWTLQWILTEQSCSQTAIFMHLVSPFVTVYQLGIKGLPDLATPEYNALCINYSFHMWLSTAVTHVISFLGNTMDMNVTWLYAREARVPQNVRRVNHSRIAESVENLLKQHGDAVFGLWYGWPYR